MGKSNGSMSSLVLSSYERGVLECAPRSAGDALTESAIVSNTLKRVLGSRLTNVLPDGTECEVSAIELACINAVADMIERPDIAKIEKAAKIAGELNASASSVQISVVDKALRDMAVDVPMADDSAEEIAVDAD